MLKFWKRTDRWICTFGITILAIGTLLHNSVQAQEMQKIQELTVGKLLSESISLSARGIGSSKHSLIFSKGKPYILHLWATWCGPCRVELPHLAHFLKNYPSLPIIPVALDSGDPERVSAFIRRLGLKDFPVWVGDKETIQNALSKLSDPGLPMTLLIDSEGRIRTISDGGIDWAAPDTDISIKRLLREVL